MTQPYVPPPRCACAGCFHVLQPGMLFCVEHWNALPRHLRDGIYTARHRPERAAGARFNAVQWLEQGIRSQEPADPTPQVWQPD